MILQSNQPKFIAINGIAFLSSVAQAIREKQFDNPPSYLAVKLAAEQSLRLALLRDHAGTGRYDLLDGFTKCLY